MSTRPTVDESTHDSLIRRLLGDRNVLYQRSMTYCGLSVTEYVVRLDEAKPSELTIVWVKDNMFDKVVKKGEHYPLFTRVFVDSLFGGGKGNVTGHLFQTGPACEARSAVEAAFVDFYRAELKDPDVVGW